VQSKVNDVTSEPRTGPNAAHGDENAAQSSFAPPQIDELLDVALVMTFPASDPIAVTVPFRPGGRSRKSSGRISTAAAIVVGADRTGTGCR
jgi:hypothetical protein